MMEKLVKEASLDDLFEKMILDPVKIDKSTKSNEFLFHKIINQLTFKERSRLRRVSKKWRELIDNQPIKRLQVSYTDEKNLPNNYRTQDFENFMKVDNYLKLDLLIKKNCIKLSNLKSLTITLIRLDQRRMVSFYSIFNSIKNTLLQLSIYGCFFTEVNEISLDLPNLISIELSSGHMCKLILNTSNLIAIKIWQPIADLKLQDPKRVRSIHLQEFGDFLKRFDLQSLNFLFINNIYQHQIGSNFFENFKNLKRFHFCDPNLLNAFYSQKQKFKLDKLSMYIDGIKMTDPNQFATIFYELRTLGNHSLISSLMKKGLIASELPQHDKIDYSEIEDFWMEHGEDYYKRFTKVDQMAVFTTVKDNEKFLRFLKIFEYLTGLLIYDEGQPLELLDQIPKSCPHLQFLIMIDLDPKDAVKYCKYNYGKFKELILVLVNGKVVISNMPDDQLKIYKDTYKSLNVR